MTTPSLSIEELKKRAGVRAVDYVESGMVVGLGTGSTVYYMLVELARRIREEKLDVKGIPTSKVTEKLALEMGIPLTDLSVHSSIDVTIDGADEVDPNMDLIKGLGGALLREKIIAANSRSEVIIADEGKLVERLGTRSPLPVEVIPFGHDTLPDRFRELEADPVLRLRKDGGGPFITDSGNCIYDLHFPGIMDARGLESDLNNIPGVLENGLFLGMTTSVVVAGADGVRIIGK